MPDTLTMPAPASTQPAATPTPSQESPASVGSATASPKVLAGAEDAFGHYAGLGTPEPVVEDGEAAQTPQSPGPADAGHPDETQGTAGAEAGKTPPVQESLPGDDILKELEAIDGPKPTAPETAQEPTEVPLTPEAIEKIVNPTGSATLEERFKNAQSYIGTQHSKYGEKLKSQNAQIGQLLQGSKAVSEMFARDDTGKVVGTKPEAVLSMFDMADPAAMEAAIDARGWKLVPKDAELKSGTDPVQDGWEKEYVNNVIPGDELRFDEKLEQVQNDPKLNRAMMLAESRFLGVREQQQANLRDRQTADVQQYNQKTTALYQSFMEGLKNHPDFKDIYAPAFQKYNQLLGPTAANGKLLDGALKGANRLQVIRRLIEFDRFPKILKDVRDKAFTAGQKDTQGKRSLNAMPGASGSPSLETDTRGEEVKGDAKTEEAFGARSGSMRL